MPYIQPTNAQEDRLQAKPEAMRRCRLRLNPGYRGHSFVPAGLDDMRTKGDLIVSYVEVERCEFDCKTFRSRYVERMPQWSEGHWHHVYDPEYRIIGLRTLPFDDQYVIEARQREKHPELFNGEKKGRRK